MTKTANLILVVDDQENWREALTSVLHKAGYFVEAVSTLYAAKEALAHKNYSLIITDIRLVDEQQGDVSGLQLLQQVREIWEHSDNPGLIVMTGYIFDGVQELALEKFQADYFLPKNPPDGFDVADFREKVERLMAKK